MPNCWICGRAMLHPSHLPLNICRRAACEPEREYLDWRWANKLAKDYYHMQGATEGAHGYE